MVHKIALSLCLTSELQIPHGNFGALFGLRFLFLSSLSLIHFLIKSAGLVGAGVKIVELDSLEEVMHKKPRTFNKREPDKQE